MPKKKSHAANDTLFGQGHKLFRGKKSRKNSGMFKKGSARKKGGSTASGNISAGNGGRFKRGRASLGTEQGQAQKPSPKQAQQLGPKPALPKQKSDGARSKQAQQFRSTYLRAGKRKDQGKIDEAVPLCREALMGQRALLGDTHKDTFESAFFLGELLCAQGVRYGTEPVFREMQEGWRALVEAQRARQWDDAAREGMLQSLENLVYLLDVSGEAELLARELLVGRSALLGEGHRDTLKAAFWLGWILKTRGKGVEAEQPLRQAVEGRWAGEDSEQPMAAYYLAMLLLDQGRLDEAEPLARQALAEMSKDQPGPLNSKAVAAECLGRLHRLRAARYHAQGGDNMTTEEGNELHFAAIMYRQALGGADTHHKSGLRELLGDKHKRTLRMARKLEEVLQAMEPPDPFNQLDASGKLKSMSWPRGVKPEAVRRAEAIARVQD
eukprot:g4429.t1